MCFNMSKRPTCFSYDSPSMTTFEWIAKQLKFLSQKLTWHALHPYDSDWHISSRNLSTCHQRTCTKMEHFRARSLAIKVIGRKEHENLTHINFTYLRLLMEMHLIWASTPSYGTWPSNPSVKVDNVKILMTLNGYKTVGTNIKVRVVMTHG